METGLKLTATSETAPAYGALRLASTSGNRLNWQPPGSVGIACASAYKRLF
jgi:hypothetical protein